MIFCTQHNIDANLVPLGIVRPLYSRWYVPKDPWKKLLEELEKDAPEGTTHLFNVNYAAGCADAYGPRS